MTSQLNRFEFSALVCLQHLAKKVPERSFLCCKWRLVLDCCTHTKQRNNHCICMMAPPNKKRKTESKVEEVTFDLNARQDYLTGFHKRKLQRAKYAQEKAAERARLDRIEARKKVRASFLGSRLKIDIILAARREKSRFRTTCQSCEWSDEESGQTSR